MSPVTPRSPGVTQSMPVLTDRFVAQHKPAAARQEIGDSLLPGHFFIIQPSGHRSFALRYRFDGKSRKLTIGTYPVVGLKAARDKARDALGKVQSGVDPGRPQTVVDDVGASIERYLRLHVGALRPGTRQYIERELRAAEKVWHGRALADISRRDVVAFLDTFIDRGSGARNTAWKVVRSYLGWAANRGEIETSSSGRTEATRTRDQARPRAQ